MIREIIHYIQLLRILNKVGMQQHIQNLIQSMPVWGLANL